MPFCSKENHCLFRERNGMGKQGKKYFYTVECSHLPRSFKNQEKGNETQSCYIRYTFLPPNPPNITLKNWEKFAHKILPKFWKTLQFALNLTSAEIMDPTPQKKENKQNKPKPTKNQKPETKQRGLTTHRLQVGS